MLSPLRNFTYRQLFLAQVTALIGTGLMTIALALLAFDLAGDDAGLVLGTALAIKMVAYVGIAPVVGGIVHLLPRKRLLVSLDLARAASVLAMPWITETWQLYVVIFVLNACAAGFTPTFQATIPDLLEEPHYTRALALSRLAYDLENLLSPVVAGLALLVVSFDVLFVATAGGFLLSAVLVVRAEVPRPRVSERGRSVSANIGFGVRAYLATPRLRGVLGASLAVAAAGAMVIVNSVVLVRGELGLGESALALAMAFAGGGSMATALVLPRLLERAGERGLVLTGAFALTAVMTIDAASGPTYTGVLALWFATGVGLALVQTPIGRVLRRSSAAGDRAAFFSAQFALSHACWLVAYPLAGWLASAGGTGLAFTGAALLTAAGAVGAWRLWPVPDVDVLEHEHPGGVHVHLHSHDDAHHAHPHEGWEGPEPHRHAHRHAPGRHRHAFVIDLHHGSWPA